MLKYVLIGIFLASVVFTVASFLRYKKVETLEDPVLRSKTITLCKVCALFSGLTAIATLLCWFVS